MYVYVCLTHLLTSLFHCPGPVAVPCITLLHGPETGPFRVLAIGLGVPNARGGVRKGPPPLIRVGEVEPP